MISFHNNSLGLPNAGLVQAWKGATTTTIHYYNQWENRIDLQFWFRPNQTKPDRVYLAINFETGFPLEPFDEDTFFANGENWELAIIGEAVDRTSLPMIATRTASPSLMGIYSI